MRRRYRLLVRRLEDAAAAVAESDSERGIEADFDTARNALGVHRRKRVCERQAAVRNLGNYGRRVAGQEKSIEIVATPRTFAALSAADEVDDFVAVVGL